MITESARPLEAYDVRIRLRTLEYGDPVIVKYRIGSRIINRVGHFKKLGPHNISVVSTRSGSTYRIPIQDILSVTILTASELEQWQKRHR